MPLMLTVIQLLDKVQSCDALAAILMKRPKTVTSN